jgi:hypothetical protein
MNAVKVDNAHRIRLMALKPGEYYEPEIRGLDADEVTLRKLQPPRKKMTKAQVLKAIAKSRLRFTCSWDELRRETREP